MYIIISFRPLTVEGNYTERQKIHLKSETKKIKLAEKKETRFNRDIRDWKDGMVRGCAIKTIKRLQGTIIIIAVAICASIHAVLPRPWCCSSRTATTRRKRCIPLLFYGNFVYRRRLFRVFCLFVDAAVITVRSK